MSQHCVITYVSAVLMILNESNTAPAKRNVPTLTGGNSKALPEQFTQEECY